MKLVIHPPVDPERLEKIRSVAPDMELVNAADESDAIEQMPGADAFFGKITPPMLAAADSLRWIQTATASLEHYVFPELVDHPCQLSNMRGIYSDVIADHVMGYVLCFARNLHLYVRQQIRSEWNPIGGEDDRSDFSGGPCFVSGMDRAHMTVSDTTMGIVGLGNIGAEIARRALAFGMRVLAVDPQRTEAPAGVEALWPMDRLDDLLAESDFVTVAAPHTPETEGMFNRARFAQMKPSGYFINIGRGAIVVLDDLCDALEAGEIAGTALDVFETEPLPANHRLWQFENAILTPHIAACSVHLAERHLAVVLENIRRFAQGEQPTNVVDKANWC